MGRKRGWVTIGAGDIRINESDKAVREREWIIKQIGGSIINLIPEKPSYLSDLLVEVVNRMSQEEVSYDANLRPVGKSLRLYVNINVCEGYQFKDVITERHREKKDTLFYRLLEIDTSLRERFYAVREFDPHGNPKLAGLSNYIVAALKYLPELAKYDSQLNKVLDILRQKMQEQGISEKEVFGEGNANGEERTIISGIRQNLPNYTIRGQLPDIQDKTYGSNIGEFAFTTIQEARAQIESTKKLTLTGYAIAIEKNQDPLTTQPKLMDIEYAAKAQEVTDVYKKAEELRQMGVWWKQEGIEAQDYSKAGKASDISLIEKKEINPERTILFGVSGGDCPGLNSALAGLLKSATEKGIQVAVMDGGFKTLCANPEIFAKGLRIVNPDEAENLAYLPSIISRSSRVKLNENNQENAITNVRGFYAVILVGGDDHARQAEK